MFTAKRLLACVALACALAPACAGAATAPKPTTHALLTSRELWATIDVCSPSDQPDTVGIRGSMPGDEQAGDHMYMSFRLQYMNPSHHWVDLSGASSSYVAIGTAAAARQGGSSFQLKPVAGKPAVTLRGVVDFQWRHGSRVTLSTSRITAAGHRSLAGADPASFSAPTCVMG